MKIPLCKMYVDNEIKKTVNDIIDAGWYINGPHVKAFEKEFSEYIGVKNAIAVNSGTSALFTTFLYLGIKPGDEIIVPSHTFIASITPAIILGAKPVFVDINPENYTMDVSQVREKITEKTKAIVCVHIYGHPVDMDPILEIAHQHEIIVIEDCAQAHGSLYKNKKIGKIGDIGCFSFFPSKIMTVGGDGGMIVTENAEIAEKIAMLKNHGRKEKYKHDFIGTNTRLAEIPAAIGRIQLNHLQEFIELRQKIVDSYNRSFIEMKQITIPISSKWANTAYYVYTIQIDSREKFSSFLKERGIATGVYYPIPVHKQPAILNRFGDISLPITEKIVKRIISLPLHPQISKSELDYIIDSVQKYCGNP